MSVVLDKISGWQRDFRAWQGIFLALQSTEITELLLSSMPATVPEDYLIQGRDLIDQMVAFWTVRKDVVAMANRQFDRFQLDDPEPLMERLGIQHEILPRAVSSFTDLIKQLNNLPPLRLRRHEYSARQLFEADETFTRLSSQLISIKQDICRLERIFDRFLTMFNATTLSTAS
ncbi:hypothetical protein GSI_08506 [Ganoderma sinense ZZ0214-1]|uniref:Uncharacterized protein n=1 Tax=Ganoderma sinense ZZ0214-1 TaxID=1077348 RepID=A0A2G8S4H8_9APHY|nr:hypothetical protein GSI_08506 [Ganoderma sinense ZZ0214-1]